MVCLICRVSDRKLGNHLDVVGGPGRRTDHWGTNISCAASLGGVSCVSGSWSWSWGLGFWVGGVRDCCTHAGRVSAITLVAVGAFTDDLAIDVSVLIHLVLVYDIACATWLGHTRWHRGRCFLDLFFFLELVSWSLSWRGYVARLGLGGLGSFTSSTVRDEWCLGSLGGFIGFLGHGG